MMYSYLAHIMYSMYSYLVHIKAYIDKLCTDTALI